MEIPASFFPSWSLQAKRILSQGRPILILKNTYPHLKYIKKGSSRGFSTRFCRRYCDRVTNEERVFLFAPEYDFLVRRYCRWRYVNPSLHGKKYPAVPR